MPIFIVIQADHTHATAILAREAFSHAGTTLDLTVDIRIQTSQDTLHLPAASGPQDALLLLCDAAQLPTLQAQQAELQQRFGGARVEIDSLSQALADVPATLQALGQAAAETAGASVSRIVAVTSCPTGIAHTFMAADALLEAAKALKLQLRVETQGSVGAGTPLSAEEIAQADWVIIAADREVERSRFAGKRLFVCDTKAAITQGQALIQQAMTEAVMQATLQAANPASAADTAAAAQSGAQNIYSHLMTGVSFMLPFRHTYTNLSKQNKSISTDLLLTSCFTEASFTCVLRPKPALSSPQALHSAELAVGIAQKEPDLLTCPIMQDNTVNASATLHE